MTIKFNDTCEVEAVSASAYDFSVETSADEANRIYAEIAELGTLSYTIEGDAFNGKILSKMEWSGGIAHFTLVDATDRIAELEAELAETKEFFETCLMEMSEIVYA